jgi:hypothetical protein
MYLLMPVVSSGQYALGRTAKVRLEVILRQNGDGRRMTGLGQKRPKLSWLPAAKNTTEQRVKFVPGRDARRDPGQ